MNNLLLVYYHPVIFDLAETFSNVFTNITIAVNPSLKDNYGGFKEVAAKVRSNPHLRDVKCIPLTQAQVMLKKFDLVGLDGVFDGDKTVMELCRKQGVPYFCINGYPHQHDEPGQNIMAFSHYLPQIQYRQQYPHEGHVKEIDWKNIAEKGESDGKNIVVFYPEMNAAKRFYKINSKKNRQIRQGFVSFIHRYQECNKWNYEVFNQLKKTFPELENYSNKSQQEVFELMWNSEGVVHLKHADCPGITVLEALVLGIPVYTMDSFVKASANQEVLIDEYNAIVAYDFRDLRNRMIAADLLVSTKARDYIWELTSFIRQRDRLVRFFEKCMN